jgi:glycosyltransferase involved in cell wall biosynthesis
MNPILIDALYINMGGGLMILNHLVNNLVDENVEFVLLKDARCPKLQAEDKVKYLEVLSADTRTRHRFYKSHQSDFSVALCFGNVPPTIKLDVPVYTYLHNVSLMKIPNDYGLKQKLKSYAKRQYIRFLAKNTSAWIVQTSNTAQLVAQYLARKNQEILLYPFYYIPPSMNTTPKIEREDYVFVGNYTSAKGHEYLLEAWVKLAKLGFKKTLHLTVSPSPFCKQIQLAQEAGASVVNHGFGSFEEVVRLYNKSKATIYPSLNESLGLGIIEAVEAGCDVIGCDLPYMHSVCKPSGLFPPRNSDAIVEAVLKYETQHSAPTQLLIHSMVKELIALLRNQQHENIN